MQLTVPRSIKYYAVPNQLTVWEMEYQMLRLQVVDHSATAGMTSPQYHKGKNNRCKSTIKMHMSCTAHFFILQCDCQLS